MDADKLHEWVIGLLEKNGSVDEEYLRMKIPNEDIEHVLFLLNYLVSKGFVKSETSGINTRYLVQDIQAIKKMIGYSTVVPTLRVEDKLEEGLVVSIPLSLTEELALLLRKYDAPVMQLNDAIKILLNKASEEILIASPFIELDGIMYIVDEIVNAAKNGVSLKVMTRDVLHPRREDYSYVNKLKGISKLYQLFVSNKSRPDATISIRDFGSQISGLSKTSAHYEGIHQKMVIVDRKYAYVGSGEIRAASFITNGEAGYLFVGQKAEFWADFFNLFWKSAIEIPSEYLKY